MGNHIDNRGNKRQKVKEHDELARRRRTSFKQYLQDLEEELLEADLNSDDELDQADE
jgi:hypothetical protein